jgi:4a-hydroxytetrahydrobiopterin dehydratase
VTRPLPLSTEEVEVALRGTDWRLVDGHLVLEHRFGGFAPALGFVVAIGAVAEEFDHHPNFELAGDYVRLELWTHDVGALTRLDVDLATRVQVVLSGEARATHRATERWSAR